MNGTTTDLRWPARIMQDVYLERCRQEELCEDGHFQWTLAHLGVATPAERLAVLSEEHGEIARIVADGLSKSRAVDMVHLREELIQLAACCVAWCECLDAYSDEEIEERAAATQPTTVEVMARGVVVLADGSHINLGDLTHNID